LEARSASPFGSIGVAVYRGEIVIPRVFPPYVADGARDTLAAAAAAAFMRRVFAAFERSRWGSGTLQTSCGNRLDALLKQVY
jgi:hypothetical protein